MKEKIERTVPLYTLELEGEAPKLSHVMDRLELGSQACTREGGEDLRLVVEAKFTQYYDEPAELESIDFSCTFKREETDDEYRRRLAQERRERATSAAFAERKKARDILKLKDEARRLGFVLALPSEQ